MRPAVLISGVSLRVFCFTWTSVKKRDKRDTSLGLSRPYLRWTSGVSLHKALSLWGGSFGQMAISTRCDSLLTDLTSLLLLRSLSIFPVCLLPVHSVQGKQILISVEAMFYSLKLPCLLQHQIQVDYVWNVMQMVPAHVRLCAPLVLVPVAMLDVWFFLSQFWALSLFVLQLMR